MKLWTGSAPANIALIKYMGKLDASVNRGSNPSLSLTLEALRTEVEISILAAEKDAWAPLPNGQNISAKSQERYLRFFQTLKNEYKIQENFLVRSRNNFPGDAGIASSASSFAALTLTALKTFCEIKKIETPTPLTLARLSRRGSGSSCRSFFTPWCGWDGDNEVYAVESKLGPVTDFVIAVESGAKLVSSSDAHLRVASSPLFAGRVVRAQNRMTESVKALGSGDWHALAKIAWAELWDMHSLFHTSEPPFFYFKPGTISVLEWSQDYWSKHKSGPITTIDAGPNVHLLVPTSERASFEPEINALAKSLGANLFIS